MTDAELLSTGELCAALLISAQFKTVIQRYEQSISADFLATKHNETEKREELYSNLSGAHDLLRFIELTAAASAQIKDPKNPSEDNSTTQLIEVTYDDEGFERATDGTDY